MAVCSRSCAFLVSGLVIVVTPSIGLAQGLFEQALQGDLEGLDAESQPTDACERSDASETTGQSDSLVAGLTKPAFELSGYVRSDLFVGKAPGTDTTEVKAGRGEWALDARARAGALGDAYAELRLYRGVLGAAEASSEVDLREAYVNLYLGPFDIRFGHQIVVWGRADGNNPTDNLTPRDMNVRSANQDDRRLANLALRTHLNILPVQIEAVWVPFFAPSRFPSFESAAALPKSITFGDPEYYDAGLVNGIGALRVHLQTASFEGSLSTLVGHATFPGLKLQGLVRDSQEQAAVIVGFSSYRHVVVGADFSAPVSDLFGIRGEAAWRRPFEYDIRDDVPLPDLQVIVGIDRELFGSLTVACQYVGRRVFAFEKIEKNPLFSGSEPPSLADLPPHFWELTKQLAQREVERRNRIIHGQKKRISHAAMLRVQLNALHETLSLEVSALVSFSTEEYMLRPYVSYAITDAVSFAGGGELYGGPDDTLFGMADELLSAGFVELRAAF